MPHERLRWVPWLILAASLLGAAYSVAGYAMAGSFTVSNPERLAHWQAVATIYGSAVIACLLLAAAVTVYLIRSRRRLGSSPV